MLFFIALAIVAAVALAAVAASRMMDRIAASWRTAADQLGLDYEQPRLGTPRLSGTYSGMPVKVDVRRQRSGQSSQSFTRYRIHWPSLGFDFRLTRQTGLSRIAGFFGAQDVELGDPGFDDAFVIKSADEQRLRDLLDPGVRGVLVRTAASYPGVEFSADHLKYERHRFETKTDPIVSTVRRLAAAAEALTGSRTHRAAADLVAARERGELAEVAVDLRNAARARKDDLDQQLLEADTLATAGDREAAAARLEELAEVLPADPDVRGWRERLEAPPSAEPRATASATGKPEAEKLALNLFSGNSLSFESVAVFEENYRGVPIAWSGRVKDVGRIRSGSDLGPEGATKLVVTVATISHDLYGNTDIDAVVALPAGSGEGLHRGDEVRFSGTLVRVDPLVRNVFVAEGSLT